MILVFILFASYLLMVGMMIYRFNKLKKENEELKNELTQAYKTIDRLKYPSSY